MDSVRLCKWNPSIKQLAALNSRDVQRLLRLWQEEVEVSEESEESEEEEEEEAATPGEAAWMSWMLGMTSSLHLQGLASFTITICVSNCARGKQGPQDTEKHVSRCARTRWMSYGRLRLQ